MTKLKNPTSKSKTSKRKAAKKKVVDRFYPNYNEFSIARRAQTDQIIQQKYGGLIAKLSKKLLIPMKKKEIEKVKQARLARQEKK